MTMTTKAPYGGNTATLPTPTKTTADWNNANNYSGRKETINSMALLVWDGERIREAARVLWFMGRSSQASVVYCTVWFHAVDGIWTLAGSGKAGGYGYHKESAAFDEAVDKCGIVLEKPVHGCGDSAVRHALHAIADAAGFPEGDRVRCFA